MAKLRPVTLITGASDGIGTAFAHLCAEDGQELVLVARSTERLELVAGAIECMGHRRPSIIANDLAVANGAERLADELSTRGLEPSIVINSAGFGLRGQASELDRTLQLAMIDLNMRTLTDLSLRWVDSMQRNAGGLINISSLASFFPGPGMSVYYATKAYVREFTEALHEELSPRSIKVTVVCPGPVTTQFHARAGINSSRLPTLFARSAERVAREGFEGFKRGRRVVITGTANKIAAFMPRVLPRSLVLALADTYQFKRDFALLSPARDIPPSQ
jgi:short-subunit dehydrogenase